MFDLRGCHFELTAGSECYWGVSSKLCSEIHNLCFKLGMCCPAEGELCFSCLCEVLVPQADACPGKGPGVCGSAAAAAQRPSLSQAWLPWASWQLLACPVALWSWPQVISSVMPFAHCQLRIPADFQQENPCESSTWLTGNSSSILVLNYIHLNLQFLFVL